MAAAPLAVGTNCQNMQTATAGAPIATKSFARYGAVLAIDTAEQYLPVYRFAAALALGSVSVLYAVVTPLALWHSADRPLAAVWTLAIIVCSYLFLWIVFLTVTMRARTVFFSISYVGLAAAAVAHLSPYTGMFFAIIGMANAAGLFGYALAERRQHDGTEQAAAAVPTPSSQSKHDRKMIRLAITTSSCYATVVSAACAAFGTWVSWLWMRSSAVVND